MIEYNSVGSSSPTLVIGTGAGEPEDNPEMKTHLAVREQKHVLPNNPEEQPEAA